MSFLDAKSAQRDSAPLVSLHEILIRAYGDKVEALAIAGSVGILQADIEVHPKMRLTWWSILEEATAAGVLRRLVAHVLKDPTVAAFQPDIRNILDIGENELTVAAASQAVEKSALRPGIGDQALLWELGRVLKIRFLDGARKLHDKVEKAASQWLDYANLSFDFGDHADAEIRVSFKQQGSWSYLGTQCLTIPDPQPNVNFGWLTATTDMREVERVVLHEFGHVLGLQHEQGNPSSTLQWNKKEVYAYFGGPPNLWSRETVDRNFFTIWPPGYFPVHKVFDRTSIEMFPIHGKLLRDGNEIGWNYELSPLDKQFVAALYPMRER